MKDRTRKVFIIILVVLMAVITILPIATLIFTG